MKVLRRWWLFWLGLGLTSLSAFLGLTSTVWITEGRQSESYPELFFLFIALPMAVLVTLAGLWVGLRSR